MNKIIEIKIKGFKPLIKKATARGKKNPRKSSSKSSFIWQGGKSIQRDRDILFKIAERKRAKM